MRPAGKTRHNGNPSRKIRRLLASIGNEPPNCVTYPLRHSRCESAQGARPGTTIIAGPHERSADAGSGRVSIAPRGNGAPWPPPRSRSSSCSAGRRVASRRKRSRSARRLTRNSKHFQRIESLAFTDLRAADARFPILGSWRMAEQPEWGSGQILAVCASLGRSPMAKAGNPP